MKTAWFSMFFAGMHTKSNPSCYPLPKTSEFRSHQTVGRSSYRECDCLSNPCRQQQATGSEGTPSGRPPRTRKTPSTGFQDRPRHGSPKEEHEEDRGEEEFEAGQGVQVPLLQPRQGRRVHHGSEGRNGETAVPHVRYQLRDGYKLLNRTNRCLHGLDRRVRSSERGGGRPGREERRPSFHRRAGDSGGLRPACRKGRCLFASTRVPCRQNADCVDVPASSRTENPK